MTDPFAIPEMTRGMRAFASPGALGALHDRFFAPLIDARRSAQAGARWTSRLTAFDADRLDATLRATLGTFAAEKFPKSTPDQRGFTAQLEDACTDVFDALRALEVMAGAVRDAADDRSRVGAWATWLDGLRDVFHAADRGWEEAHWLLDDSAPPRERRSRRHRRGRRPRA